MTCKLDQSKVPSNSVVGEIGARDSSANAPVLELVGTTAQARFDITPAFAASELREGHAQDY